MESYRLTWKKDGRDERQVSAVTYSARYELRVRVTGP